MQNRFRFFPLFATAALSAALVGPDLTAQDGSAVFEVTFTSTWSKATHPVNFPSNPHYSPLIGATHDDMVRFWQPGGIATDGIESMAETGSTSLLTNEINAAINRGTARSVVRGSGLGSPGSMKIRFVADASHPQLTIVTMLAPSPDWFVGLTGLELMKGGRWIDSAKVAATLWDAGTDSGVTYTSPNANTNPRDKIAVISTTMGPFKGYSTTVGSWSVERIASSVVYGCGVNPKGSLRVVSGEPLLGQTLTLAVHDPGNSMSKGSLAFLLFSLTADRNFPCGTKVPGFGMASPGAVGEILIGNILLGIPGGSWNGAPVSFPLSIPNDNSLIGAAGNLQGGLASPSRVGVADAVEILVGK